MTLAGKSHNDAMIFVMNYCVTTPERGLVLKPYGDGDGIFTDYKFEVTVKTDSDYENCLDTRSVTENVVYLNGVPVTFRCSIQKNGEFVNYQSGNECSSIGVQDALFMKNILKSLGLKVKLPILASIDNSRALDIGNNWSVGGRICHVKVKQNFHGN